MERGALRAPRARGVGRLHGRRSEAKKAWCEVCEENLWLQASTVDKGRAPEMFGYQQPTNISKKSK